MQYESNRPSGSSGGLIVALLLVLLVGGIGVAGLGTYLWVRSQATALEAAAMERAAMEKAVMEAQAAALRHEALQAQARQEAEDGEGRLPSVETIDVVPADAAGPEAAITIGGRQHRRPRPARDAR